MPSLLAAGEGMAGVFGGKIAYRVVIACDKREAFAQRSASDEAIQFCLPIASLSPAMTASLLKILRPQFDRGAVRCAVGGVVPGVAVAVQGLRGGDAFLGDQTFECRHPVPVIGLAGVGIAG